MESSRRAAIFAIHMAEASRTGVRSEELGALAAALAQLVLQGVLCCGS